MKEGISNKERWDEERMGTKKGTEKGLLPWGKTLHIGLCLFSIYKTCVRRRAKLKFVLQNREKKERRFGGRGYSQQRWILKMTIGRHYTWSVKLMGCVVNFSLNAHQPQSMRGTILRIFNDLRIVKHIMHTYFTIFFIKKRFSYFRKTAF